MQSVNSNNSANTQMVDDKYFKLLVSTIKDYAIFLIDPNGYIMSWNPGAHKIKGYTEEEAIGSHISRFYTIADQRKNEPRKNLNEALKKGAYEAEGWRLRKDGTLFWARVSITTLYNENGHLVGFAKVTRDITEQKNTEHETAFTKAGLELENKENLKKLISNEQRFRKLIEHSYGGISLFDKDLRVIYRSNSSEGINGWNDAAMEGMTAIDIVHPEDKAYIKKVIEDVISKPRVPIVASYRIRHRKGYYMWIESLLTNMLDDKSINAIVCNFIDVTARKRDEEEIRKKTEQIENILESITDGFIALDTDLRYTYVNKKITEMLGYPASEMIGKSLWEIFPDTVDSKTFESFNTAVEQQRYVCNEGYYEPLHLWHEDHIYPSPNGLSVFIRNITDKKIAELEREKITTDLIRRNQDLEQFTYIVSHNLRSPVANIKGLTHLLSTCEDDDDNATTLAALSNSISNLDKIIMDLNQILQTGRQGNDKYEEIRLPDLVEEISSGIKTMIDHNHAIINCDFKAVDNLYTLKSYLYSIFQNLIVNSIKYRQVSINPVISIRTSIAGDKVFVLFSDNGKGIDLARYGDQLFGLYKRFDYSVEGKGMGLFMTKIQVESLGGKLSVESELDKGSVFRIELPLNPR